MTRCCLLSLLLLARIGAAEEPLRLAVLKFDDPSGRGLGAVVAEEFENQLSRSRYLKLVTSRQFGAFAEEQARYLNNPGWFVENPDRQRLLPARVMVTGQVTVVDNLKYVSAKCLDAATAEILPGTGVQQEGQDLRTVSRAVAETLHAQLTRGGALGAAAEEDLVRNDNSPVSLKVRFGQDEAAQTAGRLPSVYQGDKVKLTIDSNQSGFLLVVGVGVDAVYQLFPPLRDAPSAITAGRPLIIPNETYRPLGMDPDGFEVFGETPSVEHIHVFFCRQPIALHIPDPRLDAGAEEMTPPAYRERFIPQLKAWLSRTDPLWNGASAAYFYAVSRDRATAAPLATGPLTGGSAVVEGTATNAAAALERGPEIIVESAIGLAALAGRDEATAHDLALLDARRNALEAALGVMLRSETAVEAYQLVKDSIDVRTRTGLVRVLKELKREQRDGALLVEISALVSTGETVQALSDNEQLRQLYEELEHPRVVIQVEEDAGGEKRLGGGVLETALARHFRAKGIDVVDAAQLEALQKRDVVQQALTGNPEAAQWLLTELQAEILIGGTATGVVLSRDRGAQTRAELNLKIINAADARLLDTHSDTFCPRAQPDGPAPIVCRDALRQAIDELASPKQGQPGFIDRLIARWMSEPTVFTVRVQRTTLASVDAFVKQLNPAPPPLETVKIDLLNPASARRPPALFRSVTRRSFNENTAVLEIRTDLRQRRARELLEKAIQEHGWELTGVNGLRLDAVAR